MTTYPNKTFSANDLRIGDVVQMFEGPFGTAIVKNATKDQVTFFRTYAVTSDVAYSNGLIGYTGVEEFSRGLPSEQTYFVYQRS